MKSLAPYLAILLGLSSFSMAQPPMKTGIVYSCVQVDGTDISCEGGKKCKSKVDSSKEKISIKIVGPESKEPVLLGNMGNVMLSSVREDSSKAVMLEQSDSGNVILWTWFKGTRRLFATKTYRLVDLDFSITTVYGCNAEKE